MVVIVVAVGREGKNFPPQVFDDSFIARTAPTNRLARSDVPPHGTGPLEVAEMIAAPIFRRNAHNFRAGACGDAPWLVKCHHSLAVSFA